MNKGLKGKFQNKKGFTLVEMLIVVAIIAILIAVSIPLVSTSLEKAREAVDDANERSAIAVGNIYYLTGGKDGKESFSTKVTMYYDINGQKEGTLVSSPDDIEAYGKGTAAGVVGTKEGQILKVEIQAPADDSLSAVTVSWTEATKKETP